MVIHGGVVGVTPFEEPRRERVAGLGTSGLGRGLEIEGVGIVGVLVQERGVAGPEAVADLIQIRVTPGSKQIASLHGVLGAGGLCS